MATLKQLFEQRETLRSQFQMLCDDYKEYIENPVPTVDHLQIEYQMLFVLGQVKQIDNAVKQFFLQSSTESQNAFEKLKKEFSESEKRKFDVSDLPKNHFTLWGDNPL